MCVYVFLSVPSFRLVQRETKRTSREIFRFGPRLFGHRHILLGSLAQYHERSYPSVRICHDGPSKRFFGIPSEFFVLFVIAVDDCEIHVTPNNLGFLN